MKKFRWILLGGLLVAATSAAQAQPPGQPNFVPGGPGTSGTVGTNGASEAGSISNAPVGATTTTTTTTGIAPDSQFVPADDAAISGDTDSSQIPDTGGEPLIMALAGLSIAGAAVAMRRKVTA